MLDLDLHSLDLPRLGMMLFAAATWGAAGLAMAECVAISRSRPDRRGALLSAIRRSRGWTVLLVVAQLAVLGIALALPQSGNLQGIALVYLVGALMLPMLWGAGCVQQQVLGWPLTPAGWLRRYGGRVFAGFLLAGMALSAFMLLVTPVAPGESVEALLPAEESARLTALIMALWLLVNAPWMEELIFRHYLLPRFTLWFGGGQAACVAAVIVTAAVFAIGHAGHLQPAWPKLIQTFGWGVLFGTARVWFGTGWAVALHLALNLSSIVFVPFFT